MSADRTSAHGTAPLQDERIADSVSRVIRQLDRPSAMGAPNGRENALPGLSRDICPHGFCGEIESLLVHGTPRIVPIPAAKLKPRRVAACGVWGPPASGIIAEAVLMARDQDLEPGVWIPDLPPRMPDHPSRTLTGHPACDTV